MEPQQTASQDPTATDVVVVEIATETDPRFTPAFISQHDWDVLAWRVYDTHRAITELEKAIRPAMEQISSGKFSLASMLLGKR